MKKAATTKLTKKHTVHKPIERKSSIKLPVVKKGLDKQG